MILVAGCAGGKAGGGSLPAVQQGAHNVTAPANSSKVSFTLSIPQRKAPTWTTTRSAPFSLNKRPFGKKSKAAPQSSTAKKPAYIRTPQFLSLGAVGGSVSIAIYQGNSLALTQGPFTIGLDSTYDFYCSLSPATSTYACTNTTPVFAPYGTDTFFVTLYDAAKHVLSVTPGAPGTSFYGASAQPYDITASGSAYPIAVSTYPVVSIFGLDAPTSCIDPSNVAGLATILFFDGSGSFVYAPYFANPITVTTTGSWGLYDVYGPLPNPYTIYGGYDFLELVAAYDGAAGSVSVSAAGASSKINGLTSQMNLYAVDRLALSPSASGINVTGLVDSGPYAFSCGTLPIADVYGNPITSLTNPVAIGGDDWAPGAAVLENVSGSPYILAASLERSFFALVFPTFVPAMPAQGVALSGSGPLEMAVSPSDVGNSKIYVLNSDGSIQEVDTIYGSASTLEPAGTISGPVGIDVVWNGLGGNDSVFATSSNTNNIFEIDNANSAPSLNVGSVQANTDFGLASSVTTSAIAADNITGFGYISFLAFDTANGNGQYVVDCVPYNFCLSDEMFDTQFGSGSAQAAGMLTIAGSSYSPYFLAANGNSVASFQAAPGPSATSNPLPAFGSPVTRIISTYDGAWNGVGSGGTFEFFYQLGATALGSLPGTRAVIVSP